MPVRAQTRARDWSEGVRIVIINPNSTSSMTGAMLGAARASAPDLQIDGWTSRDGPPAIQGRDDGAAATPPLLELAKRAEDTGADGIVIGCFDDTALEQVASSVSCPVVGIGQAAFFYCALRRWRFSVITTLPVSVPILEENIARYGLTPITGNVRAANVPVLDLEKHPQRSAARILAEAEAALDSDPIDAIVLGCAGMVHVTDFLRARLPCAIVDPLEAAAGCINWLATGKAARGRGARRA